MFTKATRAQVPLWIGISGASGSGKTWSALALATGIQTVFPGPIRFIGTENGRATHYADNFDFEYCSFRPPHSSQRYLEIARAACSGIAPDGVRYGPEASCVIIDSMSHEHTGDGGYRSFHAAEQDRLMALWKTDDISKVQYGAWSKPSQARQKMVEELMSLGPANIIFCFRARKRTEPQGKKIRQLGYCPIGSEALIFEMTVRFHLPVNSNGRPEFKSSLPGEYEAAKVPEWARGFDMSHLNPNVGRELAQWAAGATAADATEDPSVEIVKMLDACEPNDIAREAIDERARDAYKRCSKAGKEDIRKARVRLIERIDARDSI